MRRHGVFHVRLHALDIGVDVAICHQNIGPAVEIVIEEKAAEAESEQGSSADFRARSFVHEEPFSLVVIEREHLFTNFSNQMLSLYHNEGKGLCAELRPRRALFPRCDRARASGSRNW